MPYRRINDREHVVYRATNTKTNKSYIGLSAQSGKVRWQKHLRAALGESESYEKSRYLLHKSIRKHGAGAFTFEVLYEAIDLREAKAVERGLIAQYGTLAPLGYNLTSGGEGYLRSPETIERLRQSHLNKKLSEAHKRNIGKAHKGRHLSAPELANLDWTGRTHSEETKQKISAAKTGIKLGPHSPETRHKISVGNKGKHSAPLSAPHKAAISAANKGRVFRAPGWKATDRDLIVREIAYLIGRKRFRPNGLPRGVDKTSGGFRVRFRSAHYGTYPTAEEASAACELLRQARLKELREMLDAIDEQLTAPAAGLPLQEAD
jgi:group I intron endonuclease